MQNKCRNAWSLIFTSLVQNLLTVRRKDHLAAVGESDLVQIITLFFLAKEFERLGRFIVSPKLPDTLSTTVLAHLKFP